MKRIIASMIAAVTLLVTVGCGGSSPSQSDMIRLAMERKKAQHAAGAKTDEESAPAARGICSRSRRIDTSCNAFRQDTA
jgi:hypothetical protein